MDAINDLTFDQQLALIDKAAAAGEDTWHLLTGLAQYTEERADEQRWHNCDLAARVVKRYGDGAVDKWAVEANIPVPRGREYRTVGTGYQKSARDEFRHREGHEGLTYSHFRTALRFGDETKAYRALRFAAQRMYSVRQLQRFLSRYKRITGQSKRRQNVKPLAVARMSVDVLVGFEMLAEQLANVAPGTMVTVTIT